MQPCRRFTADACEVAVHNWNCTKASHIHIVAILWICFLVPNSPLLVFRNAGNQNVFVMHCFCSMTKIHLRYEEGKYFCEYKHSTPFLLNIYPANSFIIQDPEKLEQWAETSKMNFNTLVVYRLNLNQQCDATGKKGYDVSVVI